MRRALIGLLASAMVPAAGAVVDPCGGMRLTDIAASAGLRFVHDRGQSAERHLPETMGSGLAWLDYDGDGWLDLYVIQSGALRGPAGEAAANRLYRNLGDGTFEDVTAGTGTGDRGYGQGVVAADVDGDGWIDLYLCNYGPDVLLLNQGDGTFRDATQETGLGLDGWSSSAAFADADGDGDLDLYVTRYVEYDPDESLVCKNPTTGQRRYCDPTVYLGATDRFYVNRGNGTFEDATHEAGITGADGRGLGVVFTDLDADGYPDIYVTNDLNANLLYRNRGDGTFENLSLFSGSGFNRQGRAEAGMGIGIGDVDGDLDADIAVSNFDVETNTLYLNLGKMVFDDVSAESGMGPASFNMLGFGLIMADLDLDADQDIYVTNGHVYDDPRRESVSYEQQDTLLLGDGTGRFTEVPCGPAFESRWVGRGLAAADYDNDGDLDLAVSNSGGPLQLLRNDVGDRSWVGVILRGKAPNTEAIGARVLLEAAAGDQIRWVMAGDSYQSSSDRRLLFGLKPTGGAAGTRPALEVTWRSGETVRFADLAPGRYWTITEGEAAPRETSFLPSRPETGDPVDESDSPGKWRPSVGAASLVALSAVIGAVIYLTVRRRRSSG